MNSQAGRIVVGYDGSAPSITALDWAAGEAQRRRVPLTVLHAVDLAAAQPTPPAAAGPVPKPDVSGAVARKGATRARKIAGSVEVTALTHPGPAGHTLIDVSLGAELVVVGAHSHPEGSRSLLGSVAFAVSARALCPVVVVRGDPERAPSPSGPVVVGVDGSACAASALLYAADLAVDTGSALIVLSAYRPSLVDAWAGTPVEVTSNGDHRSHLGTRAAKAVITMAEHAAHSATALHPGLEAGPLVLEGRPVDVLCQAGTEAQMLVIGSRGHGGVAGLSLGSVSRGVLQLAPCPVTVIKTAAWDVA